MYTSMSSRLRGTPEIPAVARRLKFLLNSGGRRLSLDFMLRKIAAPRPMPLCSIVELLIMLNLRLSDIPSSLSTTTSRSYITTRFADTHLKGRPVVECVGEGLAFPRLMKAPKTASYRIGTGGVPCSEAFSSSFLC